MTISELKKEKMILRSSESATRKLFEETLVYHGEDISSFDVILEGYSLFVVGNCLAAEKSCEVVLCAFVGDSLELDAIDGAEYLYSVNVLCAIIRLRESNQVALSCLCNEILETLERRGCRYQYAVWVSHKVVDILKDVYIVD